MCNEVFKQIVVRSLTNPMMHPMMQNATWAAFHRASFYGPFTPQPYHGYATPLLVTNVPTSPYLSPSKISLIPTALVSELSHHSSSIFASFHSSPPRFVSTYPGQYDHTFTPSPSSAAFRYAVNIFSAALLIRYAGNLTPRYPQVGSDCSVVLPSEDDTLMRRGAVDLRRSGRSADTRRVGPKTLVEKVDSSRARVGKREGDSGQMPALLISTSSRPYVALMCAAAATMEASLSASSWTKLMLAVGVLVRMRETAVWPFSSLRAPSRMWFPGSADGRAGVSKPPPLLPPGLGEWGFWGAGGGAGTCD